MYEFKNLVLLNGGENYNFINNKFKKILNYIKLSDKKTIKNNLLKIINHDHFCTYNIDKYSDIVGKGSFGKVYIPKDNNTLPFKYKNININLPIIIKESNNYHENNIGMDIIGDKLYINGYFNITTETLILIYVKQLWSKSIHLPLILGYGICSHSKSINRLITFKYGLNDKYELNLEEKIYDETAMWNKPNTNQIYKFSSFISTVKQLLAFIHYNKMNDLVKLPNNVTCNFIELFDYLCISYLSTFNLLIMNNIYPSDLHADNIFIHWLNDYSYFGNKNIKNIKEIFYKVNKKYYKIKTFGLLPILGDLGTSIIKIRDDIILVGQIWDIKENYTLIDRRLKEEHNNIDFIKWGKELLTPNEYKKTIAYNIFNSEPYASYPQSTKHLIGKDIDYLNKLKSTEELLSFYYEKYGVNEYKPNDYNILIKSKKYINN